MVWLPLRFVRPPAPATVGPSFRCICAIKYDFPPLSLRFFSNVRCFSSGKSWTCSSQTFKPPYVTPSNVSSASPNTPKAEDHALSRLLGMAQDVKQSEQEEMRAYRILLSDAEFENKYRANTIASSDSSSSLSPSPSLNGCSLTLSLSPKLVPLIVLRGLKYMCAFVSCWLALYVFGWRSLDGRSGKLLEDWFNYYDNATLLRDQVNSDHHDDDDDAAQKQLKKMVTLIGKYTFFTAQLFSHMGPLVPTLAIGKYHMDVPVLQIYRDTLTSPIPDPLHTDTCLNFLAAMSRYRPAARMLMYGISEAEASAAQRKSSRVERQEVGRAMIRLVDVWNYFSNTSVNERVEMETDALHEIITNTIMEAEIEDLELPYAWLAALAYEKWEDEEKKALLLQRLLQNRSNAWKVYESERDFLTGYGFVDLNSCPASTTSEMSAKEPKTNISLLTADKLAADVADNLQTTAPPSSAVPSTPRDDYSNPHDSGERLLWVRNILGDGPIGSLLGNVLTTSILPSQEELDRRWANRQARIAEKDKLEIKGTAETMLKAIKRRTEDSEKGGTVVRYLVTRGNAALETKKSFPFFDKYLAIEFEDINRATLDLILLSGEETAGSSTAGLSSSSTSAPTFLSHRSIPRKSPPICDKISWRNWLPTVLISTLCCTFEMYRCRHVRIPHKMRLMGRALARCLMGVTLLDLWWDQLDCSFLQVYTLFDVPDNMVVKSFQLAVVNGLVFTLVTRYCQYALAPFAYNRIVMHDAQTPFTTWSLRSKHSDRAEVEHTSNTTGSSSVAKIG